MKKIVRIMALLLVITMLATLMIGCKGDKGKTDSTTVGTVGGDDDGLNPNIEAENYNGYVFKILCNSYYPAAYRAEEMVGTVINDAVYTRNDAIATKYNIKFEITPVDNTTMRTTLENLAMAEKDDIFDLVTPGIQNAFRYANAGFLTQLNDMPVINFEKSYWWSNILSDTSIAGKNYFAISDINLDSFRQVLVVLFNKDIARDLKVESFYDVVEAGEWTIDKFFEFSKMAYSDATGDGVSADDSFGFTGNTYISEAFTYGANFILIPKDANDIPYMNVEGNQIFFDYFEKIMEIVNDSTTYLGEYQTGEDARINAPIESFTAGRVLFWCDSLYHTETVRTYDLDFGLLPVPKASVEQEHSGCLHADVSGTICLPSAYSEDDHERWAKIVEDMSYQSTLIIRPAYYDLLLQGQLMKDEESTEMLPYILNNIRIDYAMVLRSTGITLIDDMRALLLTPGRSPATAFQRKFNGYRINLETAINKMV